jgi:[ribosomal protein S5]-alanine N-acetyltransferase
MFKPNCSLDGVDPIVSERLELRPMTVEFFDAVLEGHPEETGVAIPDDWPDDHDRRFLELRRRQLAESPELDWRVYTVVRDGEMIGHAGFHGPPGRNARNDPEAVEIGYTVFPPHRRRGYATEAARALVAWARDERGIRRFLFSISPTNEPSLAIARKLGFTEVGCHWDDEDGEELQFELRL